MKVLIAALLLTLSSCTYLHDHGFNNKNACSMAKTAAGAGTVAVGAVLGCSGVDVMVSDMQEMLVNKTHICTNEQAAGAIAALVCPAVINYLVDTGLKGLPKAWNCTGSAITELAKTQVIAICSTALPY